MSPRRFSRPVCHLAASTGASDIQAKNPLARLRRKVWPTFKLDLMATAALLLAGCATPHVPLQPLPQDFTVAATSSKTVQVDWAPGIVEDGSYWMGTHEVRMDPAYSFNWEDQEIFVKDLRFQLQQLGLFGSVISDSAVNRADVRLILIFNHTKYIPAKNQYQLSAHLAITGGQQLFSRTYAIDSNEGKGFWEIIILGMIEGKQTAASMLMRRLIADIESWVAENP